MIYYRKTLFLQVKIMRILVISDTHGDCSRVCQVYKKLVSEAPLDLIVHCGDYYSDGKELQARLGIRVAGVKGNSDGCYEEDEFLILETEAGNFLVTHGHMQHVGVGFGTQRLCYKAEENGCIGALFGHTHRAVYTKAEGMYLMNPGSLSEPRDNSGGTFGLLVTSENDIWGKIYRYEDFIDRPQTPPSSGSSGSGSKPKVQGGFLKRILNYSDRF